MSNPAEPTGLLEPVVNDSRTNQTFRFIAIVSYVLNIATNLRYSFGHRSPWDDGHQNDVGFTPFTANPEAIVLYQVITVVSQFIFLSKFFLVSPPFVNCQFVISNVLLIAWSYLFARSYYVLSELIVILNFLLLLAAYMFGRTFQIKPLKNWFAEHAACIVMPLVWSHYLIFWNGAVMFGARNLPARLFANCLIWVFLVFPGSLLLLTGDYILGFMSAWIAFALGLGQLFTKVFALQWVFAFTIGTILLMCSILLAFVPPMKQYVPPALAEVREEVLHDQETAPLLTDG